MPPVVSFLAELALRDQVNSPVPSFAISASPLGPEIATVCRAVSFLSPCPRQEEEEIRGTNSKLGI